MNVPHATGWRESQETTRLAERAAELFPNAPALAEKWIGAIRTLRRTPAGWMLEAKVQRKALA